MSVAMPYNHTKRPDGSLTVIANLEDVHEQTERLKQRGFPIDKNLRSRWRPAVTIKVAHYLNPMCLDAGFKIGVTRAIFPE